MFWPVCFTFVRFLLATVVRIPVSLLETREVWFWLVRLRQRFSFLWLQITPGCPLTIPRSLSQKVLRVLRSREGKPCSIRVNWQDLVPRNNYHKTQFYWLTSEVMYLAWKFRTEWVKLWASSNQLPALKYNRFTLHCEECCHFWTTSTLSSMKEWPTMRVHVRVHMRVGGKSLHLPTMCNIVKVVNFHVRIWQLEYIWHCTEFYYNKL